MDVLLRSLEDGPWEPPNWNQSDFCVSVACFFDFPENYDGLKKVGLKTVLERFWRSEGVKTVKFYVAPWITTHKQTKKQKNKQTNKQVLLTLHFILFFKSKSPKITTCMFAFFFVTLPFTFVTSNRSLISPSSPIAIVSALTWLLSHNAYHQQQQSNTYFLHSSFHSYFLPFPKIFVNCWETFSWYI